MPLPPRQRPQLEDIERRILYSADTPTGALAATLPRTEARTEQTQAAAPAQPQPVVELVMLDERVPDADALLQDIAAQAAEGRSIEVVRVGADEDGVAAITAALAGRSDVAALHIVSHGGSGAVQLGQEALDNDTLLARAADIAGWGSHLGRGADILLYGCDVASDDAGRALVQGLADLTGADVAASTDATGAAALGGNWLLEMQTGHIEARLAFDLQTQAQWQGLLATYTVTSTADSGAGTLRQAITDANANAGADTIVFNIAGAGLQTINLTSALPTITGALSLNGYTQSDAAVNSASTGSNAVIRIALNGSGAGAGVNGLNFGAGSEGSSVRGLAIGGFTGAGILTSVGGLTVAGNFIGTNAAGTAANANATGISVAGSGATTIGSATLADRNLVSGNTNNIVSSGTGALTIQGNLVGTNNGGSTTIGTPTAGISISAGTANAVGGANAGEGNVIAGGARGVVVTNTGTVASIVGNTISQTTTLGIDLGNDGSTANDAGDADTGANALQNFPVITGAQTSADGYVAVQGTLNSTAGSSYRIDFYASPSGTTIREGRVYLGYTTVTTDASGNVTFKATLSGSTVATGALISATATRLNGTALAETSEFSAYQATTAMNVVTVTTTAYSGAGSLEDAINAANAAAGPTLIRFNIAGTGLHTITFPTLDPDNPITLRITKQVILDATTDDSFAANGSQPAIQIDGNGNESAFTLASSAAGSTVRGFAITNFSYSGIYIESGGSNNVIAGNYIGTIGAGGQMLSTSIVYGIWVDTGTNNRVGGSSAADRNVIAGITGVAIAVTADGADATGNVVQGNYIGVMPDGLSAVSSPGQGIQVAAAAGFAITNTLVQGNWVARTDFSAISVNGNATGTTVQGNRIGTDAAGTANWGTLSSAGIFLSGGAANNLFQNNVVAFSGANGGILMAASTGAGNAILANQIYSNAGPGIDLGFDGVTANDTGDADTGANSLQNFPVLTLARTDGAGSFTVNGTINSTANTYIRIELFSNPANDSTGYGEGQTYLGFVNVLTDGSGNASFSTTLSATVAAGAFISATATRSNSSYTSFSDTSEFARSVVAISTVQNTLVVDTNADTVNGDTTSLSTLLANKGADGFISLREALLAINNTPASSLPTLVSFNISGNVVHTITLASALPFISKAVVIDGTTDTGSVTANGGRPAIVINVNGIVADGLRLAAGSGGSTIRGLVIQNYVAGADTSAIRIMAGSDGNTIAGNYLGAVGANGEQAAVTSGDDAIWIQSSNNTIGGNTAADRNVIGLDGRSDITTYGILITVGNGNQILGNYVGVNASGTTGFTGLQSGIWINGSGVANTRIENNLVSGAGDVGIAVSTSGAGTQVLNNRIGINAAGTGLISTTTTSGITIFPGGAGAVVSGNWIGSTTITGMSLRADGITAQGNRIGTDLAGTANWGGRQSGIRISANNMLIGGTLPGQGNIVAFSNQQITTADAISVTSGTGNAILGNSIYGTGLSVGALGIDLDTSGVAANDTGDADTGANNLQNFPVLAVARTNGSGSLEIAGSINSTANTYIRIELFSSTSTSASGYGEGQTYLGFVNVLTDGSGNASFSTTLSATVAAGAFISATATRSVAGYGSFSDTSEFARSVVAISTVQNTLVVDTAADTVDGDTTSLSTLLATKGADGFISLREALLAINGTPASSLPTLVNFGISGTGVHTITLGSELPTITRPVVINATTDDSFAANSNRPAIVLQGNGSGSSWSGLSLGTGSSGSTVRGLVIRGFDKAIYLQSSSSGNTIVGNYLGPLQADGSYTSAASAQTTWGVLVEGANNTIGGTAAADRNVIAGALGSGANIGLQLGSATGNRIIGNYLGTNASGTPLGLGGEGVYIRASAANNQVGGTAAGEGNLIAGSGASGVSVFTGAGTGNAVLSNSIHSNGGLGINLDAAGVTANDTGDADTGANNLQNFPVLTLARTNGAGSFEITGTINSTANTYIRIELFANTANDSTGYGEGQTYLGFVNVLTDGSGNASFSTTLSATVAAGAFISATATRSVAGYGSFSDTSEFAKSIVAVSSTQAVLVVDTAADTLDGDTTSISTLLASKGADGFISLREALIAINNTPAGSLATLVNFGIFGTGVHTITLSSELPDILRPVVINGTTDDSFAANSSRPAIVLQGNGSGSSWNGLDFGTGSGGSTVRGLVIRGFDAGIRLQAGSSGNTIAGNYLGPLQADGSYTSAASAQVTWGVLVESANNTIGGTTAADRNVIAGAQATGANIGLQLATATGNRIVGNYLGTNAGGTPLGLGGEGVYIRSGASNNQVGGTGAGEGNLIAGSGLSGVSVFTGAGTGNAILGNSIHSNGSLGINLDAAGVTANDTGDADTGANNLQNFPVLTLARTNGAGSFEISGTINSTANTYIRIELFASTANDGSGYGEGQTYLGFVNVLTNGSGNASFSTTISATVAAGAFISATATRSVAGYGSFSDTSEFAKSIVAVSSTQAVLVVDTAADSVDGDTTSISTLLASKGADGFISLREALLAINNTPAGSLPTLVNFGISGTGVHTITLGSALPTISRPVVINATTDDSFAANGNRPAIVLQGNGSGSTWFGLEFQSGSGGSTVRGLVIRGFNAAIYLRAGSDGNTIVGNYIGALQADGTYTSATSAQTTWGVEVESANNTIGGTTAADRNVISGMLNAGAGVSLETTGATGNRVIGNYLGTNASGTPLGVGAEGVITRVGAFNNMIGGTAAGEGNLIAGSALRGVWVTPSSGAGNAILGNSIYSNASLGIDLGNAGVTANDTGDADTGPNNLQNFPVLTLARTNGAGNFEISGTINSTANTYLRIELFANTANDPTGYGEGQTYLGFVNVLTDGSGNASFSTTLSVTVAAGAFISATATKSVAGYGSFSDTSEFARSVVAIHTTQQNVLIVTTASDTVDGDTTSLSTLLATKGADGFISLREALLALNNTPANGLPTLLNFGIAGTGVHTITLGSVLPAISKPVVINASSDDSFAANGNRPAIVLQGGGYTSGWVGLDFYDGSDGSTVRGLVIQGFEVGIYLRSGADGNTIAGNYIGPLQADGSYTSAAAAQSTWGVIVESANNTIGGTTAADRNVVAGLRTAGAGIYLLGTTATGNRIIGNTLGSNASGTPLGVGGEAVILTNGAHDNRIGGTAAGEGNLIAGSELRGVWLAPAAGSGNAILSNTIHSNGGLGIDLGDQGVTANDAGDADTGPNNLQNFPVLASVGLASNQFTVTGTLNSEANKTYRIEFYGMPYGSTDGSGNGEGNVFLGFIEVTTDASGNASIGATLAAAGLSYGAWITATATEKTGASSYGSTSEFAANVQAANTAPVITVPTSASYTENAAPVTLAPGATVVDTELAAAGNYAGATLTLQRNGGANAQDLFAATGGSLSALTQGGNLVYGGTTVGTVTTNSGGRLVLSFNANATQTLVDNVLRAIGYANSSDAPPASVQLDWSFSDGNTGAQGGGGALVGSGSTTVSITAVNDAPVVTTTGSTLSYTENAAATVVDPGVAVSDADNTHLGGATVTISGNYVNGQDVLAFVNANGITGSWNAATGVLTLTGSATVANYQAALRSITYVNTSDNPSTATRTVSFVVNDGTASSAAATRDIAVTAVNDAPVITSNGGGATAAVSVPENGTAVTTVAATDPDGTTPTYAIAGGADAALFSIDATTGVLRFIGAPDHENPLDANGDNVYEVIVRATDGVLSDDQALSVTVTNVNEAAVGAVSDVDAAANQVAENAANGTVVGVTAFADDPDTPDTVSYSLTDNAGGRFAIDASTGVVTVANGSLLDYEAATSHQITVLATSSDGSTASASFTVTLTDVNEAPVGAVTDVDPATNTVAENAANGTVVGITAQALDPDGTATVTYSLSNNAGGRFSIDASTGVVTVADGSLLNYEAAASHQITVVATSSDGSTASANFTINLSDVNEAPIGAVTDVDAAANTVSENAANGTVVGITAQALDPDGTATVSYSLSNNAGGRFTIDANTGVVTVADGSLLNYEAAASHQITVVATSSDGSTASANFTINLTDVNEAPVGVVTDVDAAANTVAENAANGTVVGITAQALDPDGTATVTYSLTNNAGGRFSIDASTGVVTVADGSLLDYEAASSHQITVLATSSDGSTASANFTINLTDVNEAPVGAVTDVDAAANAVLENAANGTVVGITAQALDPDGTATVTYSLSNSAGGRFTIDASTGVVTVANGSLLDYEVATSHQITVVATSSDGSTSSANFTISLSDVNEAPVGAVTDVDAAANTVAENAATGTVVGITAQALDPDGTATVTYSLSNNAGGRFSIDASTGVVTVADGSLLNYEAAASHQITVLATSSDGSTSSASFTINLTDVNEAPVGAVTDVDPAANTVVEHAVNGTVVGITAQALDPDGTATVTYSLTNTAGGRFAIDASTGVVTVADGSLLDYEAASSHQITVLATSSDGSTASANFTINLTDVNEAPVGAVTDVDAAANAVLENATNGTVVGITAQALDPDGTATVTYSLTNSAGGRFTIDANTGVVTVANGSLLDYESATSHQITVLATSSDGSTASANFTIALGDANEAPVGAVSDVDPAANTVAENAANGTAVGITAQAIDPDGTATVTYSLSNNAGGRFTIDASTGVVTVANG
ncbi:cadherin domain-containing protein, partial [Pseudorhodoferax aquiterrae]|uniref:cadherin domain-containing protein n=1 Tax=Pseudorhodoferax aquiterrae TaxID=747304 RepID=UPI00167A5C34